jgi:hypothetical protein
MSKYLRILLTEGKGMKANARSLMKNAKLRELMENIRKMDLEDILTHNSSNV